MVNLQVTMEAAPPPVPPPLPTRMTIAAAATVATVTNNNRIIGLGDQTDLYVDTRTTINRANQ